MAGKSYQRHVQSWRLVLCLLDALDELEALERQEPPEAAAPPSEGNPGPETQGRVAA